jgi:gliding motility-associated-like protein
VNGPAANFEADIYQGCKNTEVTFKDLSSTGGLNAISKWDWKFGDGTSQQFTQPPFKHVYASGGSFDVVLTVTDLSGCSASLTKKAFILIDGAEARFTSADTITCNGSEVVFKNQSTGSISGSLWHFGDGKTSTSFDAVHAYADTGVYPVKLVVTTSSGCMDSLTRKNYVTVKNPKAKFGYTDPSIACASFQINFYDSSYFAKSWLWEFGDGKTSTLKNPSHTYTAEGTYTVKLTITSSGGCLSTYSTDVKVAASRNNLVYSPLSGCKNNAVTFYTMSKGSSEFILDFGDGEVVTSRDSVILHIYKKSGRYLPKILFKEPASCSAPIFGKDTINIQGITANFISDTKAICERGEVKFKDSSVANTAMSYMWDFGDGTTSTVKNPLHTYAVAGTYDVKLVVTTLDGCTDSITKPAYIRVAKFPVAAIVSQSEACEQAPVTFSPQIASDTSTIIKWLWSFGNGQTSSSKNPPPQLFATAGNYTNTLTVVNSTGCSTEVSKSILLHPVPQILTNDTTICKGDNVQLLASGTTTYKWSPAPSLSCIDCSSPIASPVVDQTYKVNATSAFNCVNADSVRIKVLQPLNVAVTPPEGSACIGDTIQLRATGASMYLWAPSATLSANNISNPKAIPSNDITYTVIGYDSLGCFRDTAYAKIKVYQYPTVELGPDIVLAAGSTKVITPVFSGSITNYLWTPAKDLSCFTCPSPVLSARGNITYGLKVSNEGGCSAEDLLNVVVTCDNSAVFIPNTFSPNNDGMNDVFYPRGRGISTLSSLRVTNRWGEVVFNKKGLTANSPSDGWDGMYKGKRAEAGVYTYMVEVICSNSRVLKYIGNITLIQ